MFDRYNINDLYLAFILVMYPEVKIRGNYEADVGYGYTTVLRKLGEEYIDLQRPKRQLVTERNLDETSYIIEYIEPLSKYYDQNGKKKEYITKKQSINLISKNYNKFKKDYNENMKQKTKSLKK